jgi:hypothetical protein
LKSLSFWGLRAVKFSVLGSMRSVILSTTKGDFTCRTLPVLLS